MWQFNPELNELLDKACSKAAEIIASKEKEKKAEKERKEVSNEP